MTGSEIARDPVAFMGGGRLAAADQGGGGARSDPRGGLDQLAERGENDGPGMLSWTPGLVANPPSSWMGRLWAK